MKKNLCVILAALTLSTSSFAQSSAASKMTTGYQAVRAFVSSKDIEARFTRTLMDVAANQSLNKSRITPEHINKVRPGDKVIITYSKSNHLNKSLEQADLNATATAEKFKAWQELEAQVKYAKENPRVMGFGNNANAAKELNYIKAMAAQAKGEFEVSNSLTAKHFKDIGLRRASVTKTILDANDNTFAQAVREMQEAGYSIYKVQRVPSSVMKKLSSAARNGWIVVGTAVAIGLVTAEQIASKKIATKNENELNALRN